MSGLKNADGKEKRMRRATWGLALLLLSPLGLAAKETPNDYKLAQKQVLHLGNGTEPKGLDPAKITGIPESHIVDNLFEGLVTLDPYTFEPKPGMAESWTISPDGKTYTFQIRKNAKWSDGTSLTAKDFVWSWARALAPETASEYAYQLYYIKNGEAFNLGKMKDAKQLGVHASADGSTLTVQLENPTPFFLRLTSFQTLYPTPRHVVEKYKGEDWTSEGHIVSNGAFKLTEWKLNQHVKVVKNPNYWDKDQVKADEVVFHPIENSATEEKTFLSGDLHMTSTVPTVKIPHYRKELDKAPDKYHDYRVDPVLSVYFFRFNVTRKPTDDVRVRRALSLMIDRQAIVERIVRGGQVPARSFTPDVAGYTYKGGNELPLSVTPAAIAEAKNLLAEAGYPNGEGMPPIDLLYNTNEAHEKIAVAVQQMWHKNLGVNVNLFRQEWKVFLDSTQKLNFGVARAGWVADYPDPNTFLDMFVTNGGNNQTGWSNKSYDALIRSAATATDPAQRYDLFQKAERILMDELPVAPIYVATQSRLVAPDLKMVDSDHKFHEWTSNVTDRWMLKYYALIERKK